MSKISVLNINGEKVKDINFTLNKADAFNAIKELYKSGEYKGKAECIKTKEVVKGQAVVGTAEYAPSKNAKNGTWLAFGIEA